LHAMKNYVEENRHMFESDETQNTVAR